jgi:GNAT superfamily N-acetyltransferase
MDYNSPITTSYLIENNTTNFFLELGYLNNDEIMDSPEIKYVLTKNWHSRIFMANFNESSASENIKKIVSKIKKMHISVLWYITPMSRPKNLQNLLMDHGFKYQSQWRSMAIDLKKVPRKFNIHKGITIKEVLNLDELKTWTDILVKSFEFPKVSISYKKYFCKLGVKNLKFQYYLGFLDEKPVASAMIFKGKEAAGLFYIGTVHKARRKGIAEALTFYLLNKAKNEGYNISTVQASEMGYPLYKKIGFKEYYISKIYAFNPV